MKWSMNLDSVYGTCRSTHSCNLEPDHRTTRVEFWIFPKTQLHHKRVHFANVSLVCFSLLSNLNKHCGCSLFHCRAARAAVAFDAIIVTTRDLVICQVCPLARSCLLLVVIFKQRSRNNAFVHFLAENNELSRFSSIFPDLRCRWKKK